MRDNFCISYAWYERSEPREYSFDEYPDWSVLYRCLRLFASLYEGEFVIKVNQLSLKFTLDIDLSTTFEYLPAVLVSLTRDTPSTVWISFFEQGMDLTLKLERHQDEITLAFGKGDHVAGHFKDLPTDTYQIDADVFLSEWVKYARAILAALVALRPSLKGEEEFLAYERQLVLVEQSITSGAKPHE